VKNLFKKVRNYLADVWSELRKVSWVRRKELATTTLVVIVFSTLLAIFIGVFDFAYSRLLSLVLR
jgi:preprotein translocase subunit SecE